MSTLLHLTLSLGTLSRIIKDNLLLIPTKVPLHVQELLRSTDTHSQAHLESEHSSKYQTILQSAVCAI